jgi:platelet-activating factor acetylhydrolase IB subunit alpha
MLSYLYNSGMHATFDALKIESNNADIQMDEPGAAQRYHGLLEKKWTSVIRLQKKVSPAKCFILGHQLRWLT